MTRKHFEALALALKNARPREAEADPTWFAYSMRQWRADVRAIAEVLLAHMPEHKEGFINAQFHAACGYETEGAKS